MNLSQSTLKRFLEYKERNLCGILFRAIFVDKTVRTPTTAAQLAGQYFEYKATGQLNYYGEVPIPEKTKAGKLSAPFERAEEQAEAYKDHAERMNFETIGTGLRAEDFRGLGYKVPEGFDLTVDCLVYYKGEDFQFDGPFGKPTSFLRWLGSRKPGNRIFINDLKFGGGLDTSYGDFAYGRDPSGARLTNKTKIKIQPIHYTWLTGLPFAWSYYSSKPDLDAAFLLSSVDDSTIREHAAKARKAREEIQHATKINGFKPYPSLSACRDCPLRHECKFAVTTPVPELIFTYYDE